MPEEVLVIVVVNIEPDAEPVEEIDDLVAEGTHLVVASEFISVPRTAASHMLERDSHTLSKAKGHFLTRRIRSWSV